ncbi:hypothetical protein FJT64_018606 [Amphibalanus amphitrite]|uniref:Uncharacterized protein n=1 Tax=Amphibalanus amphitrite TaxID=1232801 RepID=A0A6A4WX03_AMPAM|nr:hypothetical protein FJT64_018606 [Amphibalanus amphitrite]
MAGGHHVALLCSLTIVLVTSVDARFAGGVDPGFNIRGRLRISRDAGFFTSDLSQLSGQWQTVDAERNAECPQKCLDAGYSYAAMQTQTNSNHQLGVISILDYRDVIGNTQTQIV